MKPSLRVGIIIGLIAGIVATLVEAFVAYNESLYFLWPWVGFFLYTPGLVTALLISLFLTQLYMKRGATLDENYGIFLGLTILIVFFVFDNLIIFPIFVAPVVWPWQDFFFNFRFPVGLIDTLANGFIFFMIGCWIEKKYVTKTDPKMENLFFKIFNIVKYVFTGLAAIYIPLVVVALMLSADYLKTESFLSPMILFMTPIASVILVILWFLAIKTILKVSTIDYELIRSATSRLIKIVIINGIINEFAFFYEIFFLYPFGQGVITSAFPELSMFHKALIQGYLVVISFQMIFMLLLISLLLPFLRHQKRS
ncbi:MAG: hypothetical protein J7L07_06440 [Candidatus Odinarchaeota archaeon]|nr:hypothetical protein [Candidatus Odinarchaeota archaeon]